MAVIGQSHPHTSGIEPAYILFLTENTHPALQLFKIRSGGLHRVATWIPTVDNMIEDLVLMAGAVTGAQPELTDTMHSIIGAKLGHVETNALGDKHRAELYELSKKSPFRSKMVLTILEESSLVPQSGRICCYQIDCELCFSTRAGVCAEPREVSYA
jgi:hypothetical protein